MNFTKAVYRKARRIAINDLCSRADILEWAKSEKQYEDSTYGEWEREYLTGEARTEYFKTLEKAERIVARGRREKGLWKR